VALRHDTNLASMVEVTITYCFSLFYDTTPPTERKMYPNVGFLESTHPTKSESE